MKRTTTTSYALIGAGLIAMSYGLARFAFGLFVPAIRADLGLSPDIMGIIGAMPFVSFAVASIVASPLAERLGAARAAVLASALGAAGLATISQAGHAVILGVGVFACGVCTGLMMPALTKGLHQAVAAIQHGRVSAIMNAGTSFGVAVCVPTVLVLAEAWRYAYTGFAAIAVVCVIVAWRALPQPGYSNQPASDSVLPIPSKQDLGPLSRLGAFAFGMGMVSSAYWLFTPDMVVEVGGLTPERTGWLWLVLGLAGMLGGLASDFADRHGPARAQSLALIGMAGALGLVVLAPDRLDTSLASAALFGIVYMSLTGIYLVTGVRLLPHRPASGSIVPFLAVAIGQAVGSPIAGWSIAALGYRTTFLAFAVLGIGVAACLPLYPRTEHDAKPASNA